MPASIRSSLRYPLLAVRYLWDRGQAVRRRLNARPKTRAEALAERLESATPAEAEKLAQASWPGLQLEAPSPYITPEGGAAGSGVLALVVTEEALKFVAADMLAAGNDRPGRILLVNGARRAEMKGRLDMALTDLRGARLGEASVALGETAALTFAPPLDPGLYPVSFIVTLGSGQRLETRGLIAVAQGDVG